MKTKSALPYFGSDASVAADIAAYFDDCSHVTIPFVGGASILPKLKAKGIVANDKNDLAINYYRVLSGRHGDKSELVRLCKKTLSHPDELAAGLEIIESREQQDPTLVAWAYWAICWVGRKGKGGTKNMAGPASVRRTAIGGNNASRIRAAASDLEDWAKQFERCEWEQVCFRELIPKVADQEGCGIYVDPPWFGIPDTYLHTFELEDHIELSRLLSRFQKTKVLVRYDEHESIRELYKDWTIVQQHSRNQANHRVGEIWIKNDKGSQIEEDLFEILGADDD